MERDKRKKEGRRERSGDEPVSWLIAVALLQGRLQRGVSKIQGGLLASSTGSGSTISNILSATVEPFHPVSIAGYETRQWHTRDLPGYTCTLPGYTVYTVYTCTQVDLRSDAPGRQTVEIPVWVPGYPGTAMRRYACLPPAG
eukprot:1696425-Rhodomonas_salina.1